jgi:hypothetical protein
MNKTWANVHYVTNTVSNEQEGWLAVELSRVGRTTELIARVVYWDADGQFSFEMSTKEIPLIVVEELIAEARQTVGAR